MADIIKTAATNYKAPKKHMCKYCDRGFVKETTFPPCLISIKKRRFKFLYENEFVIPPIQSGLKLPILTV